jgi:hypothetical protein
MKNLSPRGSLLGSTWMATTGSRPEPAITSTCGRILSLNYPIWPLSANSCFLPIPMLLGFQRARDCFHFYVPPCGHGRGGSPSNRAGARLADTHLTRNHLLSKAKSKSKPDGSNDDQTGEDIRKHGNETERYGMPFAKPLYLTVEEALVKRIWIRGSY